MNESLPPVYEFHNFRVDAAKRLLYGGSGETLPLSPKVFDTLLYLLENRQKVIEKDELMKAIWNDTVVEENNLNKNISILRRALGEKPGEHRFIVTVPGHGYRFVPEVKVVENNEIAIASRIDGDSPENVPDESSAPPQISRRRYAAALVGILAVVSALAAFYWWRHSRIAVSDEKVESIAVLPFMPLVAENRNEGLELGMADALITKLAESREIVVRPLGSVRRYASLEQDALSAGRELETDAVLSGTIQNAGERLRISARLVRVSDGKQIWAGRFDEKPTDVFAVQDSISQRVATVLKIKLEKPDRKGATENLEAYQLYMKGRFHVYKGRRAEIETGISYFLKAVEIDADYALAYVGLADAYRAMSLGGDMPSDEFLPKAKAAANKALEIDSGSAEAHSVLGSIIFWYDWDWEAAENQYRLALELDPNSSDTLQFYAHLLSNTGRHEEALARIGRARELDPLNLRVNALEAMFLLHAGKTDEAIAAARKTLKLDPTFWLGNTVLCWSYTTKGMFEEALGVARKQSDILPGHSEPIASSVYVLAKTGKTEEARRLLDELLNHSKERYVAPYHIALAHHALGEREKAMEYLEKAIAVKDLRLAFLKVDPRWNNLRGDPRFVELMRRMNFP